MQIIRVEYLWAKERLVQAVKNHSVLSCRPVFMRGLDGVFVVLFLLFLWLILTSKSTQDGQAGREIMVIPFVFWFWFRLKSSKWWLTRNFDNSIGANTRVAFEITEEKIKIENENLASTKLVWQALVKVAEAPEGFLLYHENQLFHWLPFDAFENEDDIGILREWAKNSGVKFVAAKNKTP